MTAAVICVLAPISIPVPTAAASVTLATFAVYLATSALSPLQSFLSVMIYILLGCAGLPVFSNFTGGAGVIAGPTGGYIIGYICCALAIVLIDSLLFAFVMRNSPLMIVRQAAKLF